MPKDLFEMLGLMALVVCTVVLSWITFAVIYW